MADYFQNGGLLPPTPNPHFLPHDIIKKDLKMADDLRLCQTLPFRLSTTFPAYFAGLPTLPINITENNIPLDLDFDGNYPRENNQFFKSRLSTTFSRYLYTIEHGKPHPHRPRHRWTTHRENTQCFNLGFRLHFLGIYAGWWAIGTLLLLRR